MNQGWGGAHVLHVAETPNKMPPEPQGTGGGHSGGCKLPEGPGGDGSPVTPHTLQAYLFKKNLLRTEDKEG